VTYKFYNMRIRLVFGLMITVMLSMVSVINYAAIGGKNKKKQAANAKLSTNTKITLGKISLTGKYQFKNNKAYLITPKKDVRIVNNYTTIQKGNKTMVITSKHTITKPAISLQTDRTGLNVKLSLSLN
jgi:hypothetical protein